MTESSEKDVRKAPETTGDKTGGRSGGKCPICGKPTEQHYRPFCSQRCQQIDLGRWLGETYRIAADQEPQTPTSEPDED